MRISELRRIYLILAIAIYVTVFPLLSLYLSFSAVAVITMVGPSADFAVIFLEPGINICIIFPSNFVCVACTVQVVPFGVIVIPTWSLLSIDQVIFLFVALLGDNFKVI